MIEESLKSRRHVIEYSKDIIPTQVEVEEILQIGYSLASSKQNVFPYKVFILGPNDNRSTLLHKMCEGKKIYQDDKVKTPDAEYCANPNLFHIFSAPYTLIVTPRLAPPNELYQKEIKKHGNYWEFDKVEALKSSGNAFSVEVGILATTITGAAIDRGWDSSYCVCFPKKINEWHNFPYIKFAPYLIQTIGKGIKFKKDVFSKEKIDLDVRPNFKEIFNFVDGDNNDIV